MTLEDLANLSGPFAVLLTLTVAIVKVLKDAIRSRYTLDDAGVVALAFVVSMVLCIIGAAIFAFAPLDVAAFGALFVWVAAMGAVSGSKSILGGGN